MENFDCRICFSTVKDPELCKTCGQIFCKNCLEIWLQHDRDTCPNCRGNILATDYENRRDVVKVGWLNEVILKMKEQDEKIQDLQSDLEKEVHLNRTSHKVILKRDRQIKKMKKKFEEQLQYNEEKENREFEELQLQLNLGRKTITELQIKSGVMASTIERLEDRMQEYESYFDLMKVLNPAKRRRY